MKDYLICLKASGRDTTKILLFLVFFAAASGSVYSQKKIEKADSTRTDTSFVMKKSAWGAVLRSAIIPGWGQVYNEAYWKVPVIWGVLGYLMYDWKYCNDLYTKYRDLYSASIPVNPNSTYLNEREFYKDERDLFAVFIGLTYFLNLIDSYVDAQLFDFSVDRAMPMRSTQISLKIRF